MGNINEKVVRNNYNNAKEIYASYGVDTDAVIEEFKSIPISVHNWQGDDVKGFEGLEGVHSEKMCIRDRSKPILATVGITSVVAMYNDYIWPTVAMTGGDEIKTFCQIVFNLSLIHI